MRNRYDDWLKTNAPAGQAWTGRLVGLAGAGAATAAVWLSVVLMAGLDLPPGDVGIEAKARSATPAVAVAPPAPPAVAPTVRYATALPPVTVVGRRDPADRAAQPPVIEAALMPQQPVSGEATVGMSSGGDNLR